ncbi:hypothetical protein OF001_U180023 [Pseudomonas sp. OF001]|nr:hypothetical protein OF001_U180023 [Pseudomonas sp. OF001]
MAPTPEPVGAVPPNCSARALRWPNCSARMACTRLAAAHCSSGCRASTPPRCTTSSPAAASSCVCSASRPACASACPLQRPTGNGWPARWPITRRKRHDHPDGAGHHLRRRQEHPGDRAVPLAGAPGRGGGAVQAAEHGAELGGHRRRRRDRPRPGGAGPGRQAGAAQRHEPGTAQAEQRHRRPGDHPRPRRHQHGRRRLPRLQARGHAGGARLAPAPRRAVRGGDGRGCRLAGGDQSARRRHRQHGLRRGGGLPGDHHRRHRQGRGVRPSGRHSRTAQPIRAGAGAGLRDQPLPRRSGPAAARPRLAGGAHRQAGARRAALPARPAPGGRGRHRRAPGRQARRAPEGGGAGAAADQQPHRLRPAAPAPAGGAELRRPRPGHPAGRPDRVARLEERAQRSRPPARAGLGGRHPAPPALRRQGPRHLRRAADARRRDRRSARPGRRAGREPGSRPAGHRHRAGGREAAAQRARPAGAGGCRGQRLRDPRRRQPRRRAGKPGGAPRRRPRRRRPQHGWPGARHLPARPVRGAGGVLRAAALGRPARGGDARLPCPARARHRAPGRPGRDAPGYRAAAPAVRIDVGCAVRTATNTPWCARRTLPLTHRETLDA